MFGRKKEDTTAIERIMWQVIKAMVTLIIFVVLLALVILPLMQDKLGISLFGGGKSDDLDVVEPRMEASYLEDVGYFATVSGVLKNVGDAVVGKTQIEFELFDSKEKKVGVAMAVVDSVDANGEAVFDAGVMSPLKAKPITFKLKRIITIEQNKG